ncbi:homeobox protein vent1-like [Aplochiton taeniatus]
MPTSRPHVPCMVQPRAPTSFEKGYLQPKPKTFRSELTTTHQESRLSLPMHPADCSAQSFSENSGYSSGYESEAASSECASVDEGSEGEREGTHRRLRTKFTPLQIHKLEKIFNKHKYLDAGERVKTATKLSLSETQVRTWFQNRRMKLKREVQDLRAEYLAPTLSPMMFQHVPSLHQPSDKRDRRHSVAQQWEPGEGRDKAGGWLAGWAFPREHGVLRPRYCSVERGVKVDSCW